MDMERNPFVLLCNRLDRWVDVQLHFLISEFANTSEQWRVLCAQFVFERGVFVNLFDAYIKDTESGGCLAAEKRTMTPLEDMDGCDTLVVMVGDEAIELSCGPQLVN